MASTTPSTICIASDQPTKEAVAASDIVVGSLVQKVSGGNIQENGTAQDPAPAKNFAIERDNIGDGITDPATGDFITIPSGDSTYYKTFLPGDTVLALLATGNSVNESSVLESVGDGTLQIRTTGVGICKPLETLNNASGNPLFLICEVI